MNRIHSSYLSAALPYVNAPPHLGHALELVLADTVARYRRLTGNTVHFVSGTDDNSLKNVRAAELARVPTAALVDENARRFRDLASTLGVRFDGFVRTSRDARHADAVASLWERCSAAGDVYREQYRGLYCTGCEQFFAPGELTDGTCPEHGTAPEVIEEDNWFFRLSRYQHELERRIESDALSIAPRERKNEVLGFVRQGLSDFSISRTRARARGWGIGVPGDPDQVVYVWFDALAGYLSALGFPNERDAFARGWNASGRRTHLLGKGILRFHAVYWPAILLSAGIELPTELLIHGYVTVEGRKIGKSLGNGVDPERLIEELGVDPLRWFLLRHVHTTKDSDFSLARARAAHDGELADQLGNLVRRTLTLVERHLLGTVSPSSFVTDAERDLVTAAKLAAESFAQTIEGFALNEAAAAALGLVASTNRYLDQTAPWKLAREVDSQERLGCVLYHAVEALRVTAVLLSPLVPDTASAIARRIGAPAVAQWDDVGWGRTPAGTRVQNGEPLFPRRGLG